MKVLSQMLCTLVVAFLLTACGGGGGGADGVNAGATLSGVLVDSPVEGLEYATPTHRGKTGTNGEFHYTAGESIVFSVGSIQFPAVPANSTITPLDIAGTSNVDHQMVSNMLVLLQSLDADGDPSNGITISPTAGAQATSQVDFDVAPATFVSNANILSLIANSGSTNHTPVSVAGAKTHFQNTLNGTSGTTKINVAPVANSGNSQSVSVGSLVSLDGGGSHDANGDALSYTWSLTSRPNGSAAVLSSRNSATTSFMADIAGIYKASLIVNDGKLSSVASMVTVTATGATGPAFTMAQTLSDGAQSTTMAFSGLALMTGNLDSQSFFPPGKVADYTGFQYLRDNDPDNMGHNTSFLTRVANNIIYTLSDTQLSQLASLASAQQSQFDQYGYQRFPLMQAFRRLMEGNLPTGSAGLNIDSVKNASRALYVIDGQISFDRAVLYANIINSLTTSQKAYLDAMKGKGWSAWPDITDTQISAKLSSLPQGSKVAVMTYASDIFSWYAGDITADVYFCPERHGTYFGAFYTKDAPAVGHEGYSIDEQMTATAGAALIDSSKGYVTSAQATAMYGLVAQQKTNLTDIVSVRTQIATLLRSLLNSATNKDSVKTQVLALSATYGELDGANNYYYASTFASVYKSMGSDQKAKLLALRTSLLSGKYADGTSFDFTVATKPFLYSAALTDSQISSYISDAATDYLFFAP